MRILAATLYAGENEFDACMASVAEQTLPATEHLVIKGLPKREAHEQLYGTFMDRRNEFDLLVKVDADMVLCSRTLFADIAAWFKRDPAMQMLGIKVHDFYTDRPMNALNTYRNTVQWRASGDRVFTDRFDFDPKGYRRDSRQLAPAAEHCPDPGPFQAFHFGVHRGVKAEVARQRGLHETAYMRCREIAWTERHFRQTGDTRLGLAVLGGEMGLLGQFSEDQLDYANPEVHGVFEQYASNTANELAQAIRRRRASNFGRWPWWFRMEARRGGFAAGRCLLPMPMRKAAKVSWQRLSHPGKQ